MRVRLFGREYAFAERVPLPLPAAVEGRPARPTMSEIGFYGTKIFAGIPMEEYNPELTGVEARSVYDRMRRSDGQVQAILLALTLPIRSAKWFVEPNDDGGREAKDWADFVEANLFGGMRYSWDDFLREALLHLVFGFSVFEKVWAPTGQQVKLDKFAPRVAPSIWRWPQDANYDVAEVEQINYVTGQMVRIPLWKCRVFTHWREGDDPEGISMLRAAYKHWLIKDSLLRIINVGVERSLVGVPVGTIPKGASQEDVSAFQTIVQNLRVDEQAGVTMPEGFLLDILEGKRTAVQALPYVAYHDEQIARSVLAQWIGLGGKSQGGSLALSQDQTDMFLMSVEAEAGYMQAEIQRDIAELVGFNQTDPRVVPKLRHKDLGYRDMSKFASAMHELMGNKTPLLTIDDGLEDYVRDMFGLPEIDPAARKAAQAENAAANGKPEAPAPPQTPDADPTDPGTPPPPPKTPRAPGGKPHEAFSEPVRLAEHRWRRELTPYERVVQFDAIDKWLNTAEEELYARLAGVVQKQGENWLGRLEAILAGNSPGAAALIRALNSLDVKFQNQMSAVLRGYVLELFREAAQQAATEIQQASGKAPGAPGAPSAPEAVPKPSEPAKPAETTPAESPVAIPPAAQAAIQARAEAIAALQTQKLEARLKLAATRAVETGDSPARILHAVRQEAAAAVQRNPDLQMTVTISVGEAINGGRDAAAMASHNVQAAQWSAILDKRTCELCVSLDGKIVDIHNPDYDRFQPPLHTRCLPGESLVSARSRITAATKRWFDGDMVTIETASGLKLSGTPNHPILTPGGWIAMGALHVGDHVIRDLGGKRGDGVDGDHQDVPARIEQVADALIRDPQMVAMPVPVTAEDFHGDGAGSQVAIVGADRLLVGNRQAALGQHGGQGALRLADEKPLGLNGAGASAELLERDGSTPRCIVCGADLSLSGRSVHALPLDALGSGPTTALDPRSSQDAENDGTRHAEGDGKGLLRLASEVPPNDLGREDIVPTPGGASGLEALPDERSRDAEVARNLLAGAAGPVLPDAVVNVHVDPFHGFVYNLQTDDGWYVANGIVTHNCRCIWVYITNDEQGVQRTWTTPPGDLVDKHANLLI